MHARRTIFLALAVLGLAGPALSQEHVEAELFTRVEGNEVRAAIELEVDFGWHIYHSVLGHPKAVGAPTVVTLGGAGITWGEVAFPEPIPYPQKDYTTGQDIFILTHEHAITLYARGRLAAGAKGDDVTATLVGQVCDEEGCIQLAMDLTSDGKGSDGAFEDFQAEAPPVPTPTEDVHEMGEADATLYTRIVAGKLRAAIEIEITPGWHLYSGDKGHPDAIGEETVLEFGGPELSWSEVSWPEPHRFDQSYMGEGVYINGHEGVIVLYAEATAPEGATIDEDTAKRVVVDIAGQTCKEQCILYAETAVSQGAGRDALFAEWDGQMAAQGEAGDPGSTEAGTLGDEEQEESEGLLGFLLAAVGWGLFTLLMPCTYPMIPITISFFTKQADARGGHVLPLSLAYGAGIVSVFVLIGVVFGAVIIQFAVHPVTNLIIGALFLYFALVLFGLIRMEPPRFLMNAAGKASSIGGYLGVFLMGVTLVITSFTCTAPFVGSLLSLGAGKTVAQVALGMGVFGATMAVPFVLLSLVPGKLAAMPKSGQWMNTLKVTLGFVEVAAALKFLSNSDLSWGWQVISREFFLVAWALTFFVAALYLFGVLGRGGPGPGTKRLVSGVGMLLLAIYCGWGSGGKDMDRVMKAILPPYSGGHFFPEWHDFGTEWAMIVDDYDNALEIAKTDEKLLLVNFTGHV